MIIFKIRFKSLITCSFSFQKRHLGLIVLKQTFIYINFDGHKKFINFNVNNSFSRVSSIKEKFLKTYGGRII